MSRSRELAGSLATVAIAALGGPLAVARAALSELVKYAQSRFNEIDQLRQVQKQVSQVVESWAASEKFSQHELELGLALAADIVARHGLSTDEVARLDFDPEKSFAAVVTAAKEADSKRWGTEDHYEVAIRAIGVTYEMLLAQLRSDEGVLISALAHFR